MTGPARERGGRRAIEGVVAEYAARKLEGLSQILGCQGAAGFPREGPADDIPRMSPTEEEKEEGAAARKEEGSHQAFKERTDADLRDAFELLGADALLPSRTGADAGAKDAATLSTQDGDGVRIGFVRTMGPGGEGGRRCRDVRDCRRRGRRGNFRCRWRRGL